MFSLSRYVRVPIALLLVFGTSGSAMSEVLAQKSYSYFYIRGNTAGELDAALTKHGPTTTTASGHHPGATKIRFGGNVTYVQKDGRCRVGAVRVTVSAQLILPRWSNRRRADKDLSLIWDTLSSDIKRHEERHAEIARMSARDMERALRSLPPQKNCALMQAKVAQKSTELMEAHDREQARFDRVEAVNFESRMTRLLTYRLKAIAREK
ncbi:DUF922 domain-containing protein [Rhizobium sp. BK251]|uniref:DUF922 domain-containing Zn-dependent protease n=1 Tax=Rhizobium sp. BK251 TaxID=2512125 RepID=UPI00104690DE|nr:DUF922 domain-containing protein [Rhizobium sp. BK251]TCL73515.1 putative secreted Zn-dependent protease [Rhizobium sp. BK251]